MDEAESPEVDVSPARLVDYGATVWAIVGGDPARDRDDGLPDDGRMVIGSISRVLASQAGWRGYVLVVGAHSTPLQGYTKPAAVAALREEVAAMAARYESAGGE